LATVPVSSPRRQRVSAVVLQLSVCFPHPRVATLLSTLSLHDALPIWGRLGPILDAALAANPAARICLTAISLETLAAALDACARSEEHTSELQSRFELVCRLLLERKTSTERRMK